MLVSLLLMTFAAEPIEPKVIASGAWIYAGLDGNKKQQTLVLRSAVELVKATPRKAYKPTDVPPVLVQKVAVAAVAKALKVKDIDWKTQMLVVVTGGRQPSSGYRLEVTGLAVKDKTMTVKWKLHAPKGAADSVLTHPATVALVPFHAGKVIFEQVK